MKKRGKKLLSYLLALVLVMGIVPWISLTAKAEDPISIIITGATAEDRTYEPGNKRVDISDVTFQSTGGEAVTLGDSDYTVTGEMDTDAAGESKDVTVTVVIMKSKYNFTGVHTGTATTKVNITKATPTKEHFDVTVPQDATYDGNEKKATVTAKDTSMGAITVKYAKDGGDPTTTAPTTPGNYTVYIDVEEGSNYAAASNLHDSEWTFEITKATPTEADFTFTPPSSLTYDANQKTATVTPKGGVEGMGEITVKYSQNMKLKDPIEPGTYNVSIEVAEGTNYSASETIQDPTNWKFTINKAVAPTIPNITKTLPTTTTLISESVAGKMPDDAGTVTYAVGNISKTGHVTVSNTAVDENGTVTATLAGGTKDDTITIPVTITSTNYEDSTVNVKITLSDKSDAGVDITDVPASKTYGDDAFTLTGTVTAAGANGAWTWTSSDNTVLQVTGSGENATVKILKAGSATITAEYTSDTTHGSMASEAITVDKATITIKAKDQTITVGGTVPSISGKDAYTVTGLVNNETITSGPRLIYNDSKGEKVESTDIDNSKTGTYKIVPYGAEDVSGNYKFEYVNGTLTIKEKSTGGGSSTPSTPSAPPQTVRKPLFSAASS